MNANERSMTHKFAEHLQKYFPGWNVDCEYNRNGVSPKLLNLSRIQSIVGPSVATDDTEAKTVFRTSSYTEERRRHVPEIAPIL